MKKIYLLTSLIMSFSSMAFASQSLEKLFDGGAGYCPEPYRDQERSRYVKMTVENDFLVITPMRCSSNGFIIDFAADKDEYLTDKGQKVDVTYSGFELIVANEKINTYKKIPLPAFVSSVGAKIPLTEISSQGDVADLQIISRKDYKTDTGYNDSDTARFGAYRIKF